MRRNNVPAILAVIAATVLAGCAAPPPKSDPSTAQVACAQQCSAQMTECNSGFTLLLISTYMKQKQCSDAFDVCIQGCPKRTASDAAFAPLTDSAKERLRRLDELLKSGAITQAEYESKRKEILSTL